MLVNTADKSFQGTNEGFYHAANSKLVSGLTRIIPDYQVLGTAISEIFRWMGYVASTTGVFSQTDRPAPIVEFY
jgi:hypothetical protein